jgi:CDP-glucose 4,6-dehydratase
MTSTFGNINDREAVTRIFRDQKPEIVFHLAAQSLVSTGYEDPVETFLTNVIGTLHILEEARHCPATSAVVCITTDKVYDNRNWVWGYREVDELGGKDPYSASKACSELVAACYRQTMAARGNGVAIATARGGNIIGGGDWAENRIVPDFVRALTTEAPLVLRNPGATRPWQHVLALVHGYLVLGHRLLESPNETTGAWNFGPAPSDAKTVGMLVDALALDWARPSIEYEDGAFPEAWYLYLDSTRARAELAWHPPWAFSDAVAKTAEWYDQFYRSPENAKRVTSEQIERYREDLRGAS